MAASSDDRNFASRMDALTRLFEQSATPASMRPRFSPDILLNRNSDSGRWDPNLLAAAVNRAIDGNRSVRINMDIDVGHATRSVIMDTGLRVVNRIEMDRDVATDRLSVSVPLFLTATLSMADLQYISRMPSEFIEPVMAQMMGTALEALMSSQAPRNTRWTVDPDIAPVNPRKATVEVRADGGPTQVVRYMIDAKASQSIASNAKQFERMAERVLAAAKAAVQRELEAIVLEGRDGAVPKSARRIDLD